MAITQDDHSPRVNHVFAARERAAKLDRNCELTSAADGLAHLELDFRRFLMAQDHSLEEPKSIDPTNQKPRVAMNRGKSHPLEDQSHRQYRVPIDDVLTGRYPPEGRCPRCGGAILCPSVKKKA